MPAVHPVLGPVTIGDLKRDGALLEILCGNCNRHLYEEPAKFPFRDRDPVPGLVRRGVQALLEVDGDRFWVMSVHLKSACFALSLKPATVDHCKTLAKQIAPLEDWIDEKEATGLPVVVMGDFNRKFDVHGQADHLWGDVDDGQPAGLNLWRLPFRTPSECLTTREFDRRHPIDFLVFNQKAWEEVDQQSFFELLYDDEDVPMGNRLSDHCPKAADIAVGIEARTICLSGTSAG